MKSTHIPSKSVYRYRSFAAVLGFAALAATASSVYAQVSKQELDGLTLMVEEEKLAGDVYQTLYEKTGLRNFANIVQRERQHQRAVQSLLQNYRLPDPTVGKAVGEFSNPEFSRLYQQLTVQGSRSNADALEVGALIEELDIADLNRLVQQTQNTDILRVYRNLTRGSRNHLRSFDGTLKSLSATNVYQPQHLTPAEYQAIVTSPHERGNGNGKMGGGMGRGRQSSMSW